MSHASQPPLLEVRDLRFRWPGQEGAGLRVEELCVRAGEQIFVQGESGAGKSTLLSLLAGVLLPEEGNVLLEGQDYRSLPTARRDRLRANRIGFVFQQFNLLPYLAVLDNVLLPCRFSAERAARASERSGSPRHDAVRLLERLKLNPASWSRPAATLSFGQQQRVVAARAFIGQPALLMADEPVSALDEAHQQDFMALLQEECLANAAALLMVSHDSRLATLFTRRLALAEGQLT